MSRDADFENVRPLVLGDEVREGEEIARVSRHAGPFDRIDFDWGVGVGLFEVGPLPPEWAGDDVGFAIGIHIADGGSLSDILIEKLNFFKPDSGGWKLFGWRCFFDGKKILRDELKRVVIHVVERGHGGVVGPFFAGFFDPLDDVVFVGVDLGDFFE